MARQVDGVEFSVIVDTSSVAASTGKIVESNEDVERSFKRVDTASRKTSSAIVNSSSKASKATANLSRSIGMGGVQIGQFAGQVQGGQSALLAFSQQGADIGMLFGPAGMVVGGVIAVASAIAGALMPSLFDGKDALEKLEETSEKLGETFKRTESGAVQLGEGIAELAKKSEALARIKIAASIKDAEQQIKDASSGISQSIQDIAGISVKDFNSALLDAGISFQQLADDAFSTSDAVDSMGAGGITRLNKLRDAVSTLSRRFDISREQAVSLASAISDFQNNPGPVGVKRLQSTLEDLNLATGNSNDKLNNFAATMIPFFTATQEGVDVTNLFRQALADLGVAIDNTKPPTKEMQEYAGNIQSLAQTLALAELKLAGNTEEAMRLQAAFQFGVSTFEQLPADAQAFINRLQEVGEQQRKNDAAALEAEQVKRKAQMETARQKANLEQQFSSISGVNAESGMSELETLQEKFNKEREIVNKHLQMKLQDKQLTQEQEKALAQQHANELIDITGRQVDAETKLEKQKQQQKLSAVSATFGALSSLMNTESKKLFEIGKAASIAGAIVDGFAAVQKTMASVPYPFNIPLAAAQAAASAVQIQNIAKTKIGDSGAGQSFSGGQVVNNTATQQQPEQRNVSIALTGSSFSGGDIRGLISAINEELGDGVTLSATGG